MINVFYINIGLLMLWKIVILNNKEIGILNNKRLENKKILFISIASLQWILISGLRHITIGGPDIYLSYLYSFKTGLQTSWTEAFNQYIDIMFYGTKGTDPGYLFFEKAVGLFTTNYQVYLFVIAVLFMIPFGIFVYRNSRDAFISFMIYSTLFYYFFSLTGFRQTLATALVVLLGYEFIKKRKLCGFIFLTLVAFNLHKSALIFFPFYFFADKKITKKYLILVSLIIPVLFIFRYQLMTILTIVSYDSFNFQVEGAGTWTFTTLLLMVAVITFWKRKVILRNNPQAKHYINALIFSLILVPLTFINPSAMRVVQYFSIFLVLLIPEIIQSFNLKERRVVYYVSVCVLIALFAMTNPNYIFFWQGW